MELLVFQLGYERCALRLCEVEEVVAAVAHVSLPGAPGVVMGLVNVRGRIATLLDIRLRLGLPSRPPSVSDHFLLCKAGSRYVAICVERALELTTISDHDLEETRRLAPMAPWIRGVAKRPDGLLLIYSLEEFLTHAETTALDEALASNPETISWMTRA